MSLAAPADDQPDELSAEDARARPLCVDLDGSLIRSDTLWEAVVQLVRRQPWVMLLLPLWLLGGRAKFKRRVAERIVVDPATLPYRTELLDALRTAAAGGRKVVLTTAADAHVAERVAAHLGLFSDIVASDGTTNVKAEAKRDRLVERYGERGFDYVGDTHADLPVLAAAERGYLVGTTKDVARKATAALGERVRVLSYRSSRLRALVKVMRPHQWAKNALVVLPLVLAPGSLSFHGHRSFHHVFVAALAALTFSLCASAGYVFNDLIDVEADRAHKTKHRRPFASGALPVIFGPPVFLGLFLGSFALAALFLPLGFLGMLAVYFAATLAYSFYLKSKLMLDVVVLAWLYTHRVLAGGIATGIPISAWLLGFSVFFFLSLAFAKRYIELRASASKGGQLKSRGYHTQDLEMVASMGPAAGYTAVLVFALYVEGSAKTVGYQTPGFLWVICPVMLYWVSRVWFLAHRGQMQDDPVKFALTDKNSWVCGLIIAAAAAAARLLS
jgi:4-hydroxybenzoate polyprenyltransferase